MDPFKIVSQKWQGEHAVLLVHGVGDYHPGDYDDLLKQLESVAPTGTWAKTAIYPFFYDAINDWAVQKLQAKAIATSILAAVKAKFSATTQATLADAFAEGACDVLWPGLLRDARLAIREALLAQIGQMVDDGRQSGVPRFGQRLSIVCHSLGCIHTYEALHAAATEAVHHLRPVHEWVRFANVIMFASPVQLFQSVALSPEMRWLIPNPDEMACLRPLAMPGEPDQQRVFRRSVDNWVSVTGEYDPVGGYLLGTRVDWAYMNLPPGTPGFRAVVDPQTDLTMVTMPKEAKTLESVLGLELPKLPAQNPHSWTRYVTQNAKEVLPCFA